MEKVINERDRNACTTLLGDIQALESQAHRLGMHYTALCLNRTKNACGWELAGDVHQAAMAARGKRPGESHSR